MTIGEYLNSFDCIADIIRDARFYHIAIQDTIAKQSERIFTNGMKSDGSKIGQYDSTKPLYANPNKVTSKTALKPIQGKTGKTKFKSGKPHKTRYVESYRELRNLLGLNSSYVDLVFFGNMKSDFENGGRGKGIIPKKINRYNYQITMDEENNKNREGIEKKYGNIFDLTADEVSNIETVAVYELKKDIESCLQRQ